LDFEYVVNENKSQVGPVKLDFRFVDAKLVFRSQSISVLSILGERSV